MQLNMLIVGVLFPTIPLMMINFGNPYSLLAGLEKHQEWQDYQAKLRARDKKSRKATRPPPLNVMS